MRHVHSLREYIIIESTCTISRCGTYRFDDIEMREQTKARLLGSLLVGSTSLQRSNNKQTNNDGLTRWITTIVCLPPAKAVSPAHEGAKVRTLSRPFGLPCSKQTRLEEVCTLGETNGQQPKDQNVRTGTYVVYLLSVCMYETP
jgi:hypothetical protein